MPRKMQDMFSPQGLAEADAVAEKINAVKPRETGNRHAVPGGAETEHRKPLPRGEPFQPKNSLVNWSPR